MMQLARKTVSLSLIACALLLASAGTLLASGETMYYYTKIPPFIETGLDPNLLLLIDNSASMYDPAYRNPQTNVCYSSGDEDLNGNGFDVLTEDKNGNGNYDKNYDDTKAYNGYFDSGNNSWYLAHDPAMNAADTNEWVPAAEWLVDMAFSFEGGTHYINPSLRLAVDETDPDHNQVVFIAAKGRFLNWLVSSKFDIEKKILTGGKYDIAHAQMILETRGCDGKKYIKDIPVESGGSHYVATFGVRPPTDGEQTADRAYDGSISNTRLDIYKVTPTGMAIADCLSAIDNFDLPGQQFKDDILNCMDPLGTGLFDSRASFNQIMQECSFYNQQNRWQNGNGSVTAMREACEKVYNVAPGTILPVGGYVTPNSLSISDICYGAYSMPGPHAGAPWGTGYVGQCWETMSVPGTGGYLFCSSPYTPPVGHPNYICSSDGYVYDRSNITCDSATYTPPAAHPDYQCNAGTISHCPGDFTAAETKSTGHGDTFYPATCTTGNGVNKVDVPWEVLPADGPILGSTTSATAVGWTDDNSDGGDACVAYAMRQYCQGIDEQTSVDPSDYSDVNGDVLGMPALLVDQASQAQLGAPIFTMTGLIEANSAPTGLIQEFKYNLRMGAMQFNVGGTKSECRSVESPPGSGRYIATLYDCLEQKGSLITSSSVADPNKLDGGKIVSYIDDGDTHIGNLVEAINSISATSWTPIAEAYFEAVGYFTQKTVPFRLNAADYTCNQDYDSSTYPLWGAGNTYDPDDTVSYDWGAEGIKIYKTDSGGTSDADATTIEEDQGVHWTQFDPILAGCQRNNILIITDGSSTADINLAMKTFVVDDGNNDGDSAYTYNSSLQEPPSGNNYECKSADDDHSTLYGSSLLDDLVYYAHYEAADGSTPSIYAVDTAKGVTKNKITTFVVSAGTLQPDGTSNECNPKNELDQVAINGDDSPPPRLCMNPPTIFRIWKPTCGRFSIKSAVSLLRDRRPRLSPTPGAARVQSSRRFSTRSSRTRRLPPTR